MGGHLQSRDRRRRLGLGAAYWDSVMATATDSQQYNIDRGAVV